MDKNCKTCKLDRHRKLVTQAKETNP
jgi:hypothetical protein